MTLRSRLYGLAGERLQMWYSRTKYALGLRPRANFHRLDSIMDQRLYPLSHKACLIISIDFELAWGWHSVKDEPEPLSYARNMACKARQNFPELLSVFEHYGIPATWATVGHLFLEKCSMKDGKAHPEVLRIPYFTNEYWRYTEGDWFGIEPGSTFQDSPEWYAPDIIQQILDSPVDHEIGCHTFSHISFSDEHCPPQVAESELKACVEAAEAWGIELSSFIFPGNLAGNLVALKANGFSAYRMDSKYELDYARQDTLGLWQIPGGICLEKPLPGWSDTYWVSILKRYVELALKTGTICHFWFHPSMDSASINSVLRSVLEYVDTCRNEVWITTMRELTQWLESRIT